MNAASSVSHIVIPMRLLSDREVSATAKLLYGLIDYYAMMSGGICYETNACLASWLCDCTPETITRGIRELRKGGYIKADYLVGYGREISLCK